MLLNNSHKTDPTPYYFVVRLRKASWIFPGFDVKGVPVSYEHKLWSITSRIYRWGNNSVYCSSVNNPGLPRKLLLLSSHHHQILWKWRLPDGLFLTYLPTQLSHFGALMMFVLVGLNNVNIVLSLIINTNRILYGDFTYHMLVARLVLYWRRDFNNLQTRREQESFVQLYLLCSKHWLFYGLNMGLTD